MALRLALRSDAHTVTMETELQIMPLLNITKLQFTVAYYFLSGVLGLVVRCCNSTANHSVSENTVVVNVVIFQTES